MAENSDKWLQASPYIPAGSVARRAVSERLAEVWVCLAKAAQKKGHQKKWVHKLRVAVRRAETACDVFVDFVPRRRILWIRKQLDKLRHATGDARDLDVLADNLPAEIGETAAKELLRQLRKERKAARRPIVKLYEHLKDQDRFKHRCKQLVRKIPKIDKRHAKLSKVDFDQFCKMRLESLVTEFFEAEPANGWNRAEWHGFRLQGKALRYGLELLAPALPLSVRTDLHPLLGELQDRLGEINDLATADELLRDCVRNPTSETLAALERAADGHRTQLIERRRAFEQWYHGGVRDELWSGLNQAAQQDSLDFPHVTAFE